MTDTRKRVRRLLISKDLLEAWLLHPSGDRLSVVPPLPEYAQILHITIDPQIDELVCFVRSAEYEPVPLGEVPTVLLLYIHRVAG